ncbi:unnamed protein product, partial [Musa acuminata var. zebrina]
EASSSFPPSRRRRPSDDLVGIVGYVGFHAGGFSDAAIRGARHHQHGPPASASFSWDPRLMFPLFAWVFWHLWVHFCLLLEQKEKRFSMPN